jgi:hypothetical protein
MNIDEYEQIKELNGQPINRKAREMLERAGEEPDPGGLHCVQLARWALEHGYFCAEDAVLETIQAMSEWRPARLMNFFLCDGSKEYGPRGWESAVGAEELALVILDDIEAKAYVTFPWYGCVSD